MESNNFRCGILRLFIRCGLQQKGNTFSNADLNAFELFIHSQNHLHQARRTDPGPWRQSHNLHEGPGHGFSCTLQDPSAKAKSLADVS